MGQNRAAVVSIIVLSWNAKGFLKQCLDSVLSTDYRRLEIIVSDNASVDGSSEMVKNQYPSVILMENGRNLGYSAGNNAAIRRSKGDLIVLLNQDTWVEPRWISELVNAASRPRVGVLGCKLYHANTSVIQSIGAYLLPSGYHIARGTSEADRGQLDEVADVDYVSGAALAIKRSVVEEIGLLDTNFFAYSEEVDWCYRAKMAGHRIIVVPQAVVHHFGSISWSRHSFKWAYLNERSRVFFLLKHYHGRNLAMALTVYGLLFNVGKAKDLLSGRLMTSKELALTTPGEMPSRLNQVRSILNATAAKVAAHLLIPAFMLRSRRMKTVM